MPSAGNVANYKLIRSLWPQQSIYDELFKASASLGLIPKDTNFVEQYRYIDVGYAAGQGIGPDLGTAKQYKSPSKAVEFTIATTPYYAAFSLNGDILRKAKQGGNKALIVDPLKRESKNIMAQVKNDFSSFIHGNGGGAFGQLTAGTTVSSQVGSLTLAADKRRFEPQMALWAATTDGTSGTVKNGAITIAKMQGTLAAPSFTVNESALNAGIPTIAAGDYLFRAGVFGNVFDGFDSWNPLHTGSPGTFRGVDRNAYADKLAGFCLDGTKMGPKARVLEASRIVADAGGGDLTYFMSTRNWAALQTELGNNIRTTKVPAASVGKMALGVTYEGIELTGPGGTVQIFADAWMPDNVERCIDRSVYKLASTGEMIHWDDGVGPDEPMVEETADAREVRAVGDIAFYTEAPWASCRVAVNP